MVEKLVFQSLLLSEAEEEPEAQEQLLAVGAEEEALFFLIVRM